MDSPLDRYVRQTQFAPLGNDGQRRLLESRALVVGCGALGSVIAEVLTRAGVGRLRIVDRDFLELNNLQRQVLYDEEDVARGLPKAIAAGEKLRKINGEIEIEPVVADVNADNLLDLIRDVDVIVDGTDNFETRYLLNDASLKYEIPWVYGGCIGASGQTLTVLPRTSPCLRCLYAEPPAPGTTETCDTAGIVAPIILLIGAVQAMEAIKILSGNRDAVAKDLRVFDLWEDRTRQVSLASIEPWGACPCGGTDFPWLTGKRSNETAVLCGRNAVQLRFPGAQRLDLEQLAQKLSTVGPVEQNRFLVRCRVDEKTITVFADGRAIVQGTQDPTEARAIYAKYVGS